MGIWLDNLERNQTALAKTDEPVVESMYINIKQRAIEGLIRKVKNIPKPKVFLYIYALNYILYIIVSQKRRK